MSNIQKGSLERVSIECRKTESKLITLPNHKGQRQSNEPIETQLKVRA